MRDMESLAREFERLHPSYQSLLIRSRGIPVEEVELPEGNLLVLFSLYNFFVEAIVNKESDEIKFIEKLSLEEVANTYCDNIPSV